MIRIRRKSQYADWLRAYHIILDGKDIGVIKRGETKDFDVPLGPHNLKLKVDWCGSNELQFEADSSMQEFEAGSNVFGLKAFVAIFYVTLMRNQYLWLKPARS